MEFNILVLLAVLLVFFLIMCYQQLRLSANADAIAELEKRAQYYYSVAKERYPDFEEAVRIKKAEPQLCAGCRMTLNHKPKK